jgi:hypothetical protein
MSNPALAIRRRGLVAMLLVCGAIALPPGPAVAQPGACDLTVYRDISFGGPSWRIETDQPYVGDAWANRISSLVVGAGIWAFHHDSNYGGARVTYRPGQRIAVLDNAWNDRIRSLRCLRPGM